MENNRKNRCRRERGGKNFLALPNALHEPRIEGLVVIAKVNPPSHPIHNFLAERGGRERLSHTYTDTLPMHENVSIQVHSQTHTLTHSHTASPPTPLNTS